MTRTESARVLKVLPNEMFLVELADGREVRVHAAGKARVQLIRVLPGQLVDVELSPFDPTKGRLCGVEPTGSRRADGVSQ